MAMKRQRVRITPESPLSMGQIGSLSNFLGTGDYLPGSALRGAVAGRLLAACLDEKYLENHIQCPEREKCPFWEVFGATHPPLFRDATVSLQRLPSRPYPLTARTCKLKPGFKREPDDSKHHGVFDTLIRQAVFEEMVDERVRMAALYHDDCPVCGGGTIPPPGYCEMVWEDNQQRYYDAKRPLVERVSHTAINRARGVAEDRLLFTVEQIVPDAGYVFEGEVVFDDAYEKRLIGALEGEQRVGRAASRGLGRAKIQLVSVPPSERPLAARLERLNELMKAERRFYAAMDSNVSPDPECLYFTLDLVSEAILPQVLPSVRPDPTDLGLPTGVELVRAWARSKLVSGWHGAARMPRRTQIAVQRGSIYLFKAPQVEDVDGLLDTLKSLELIGIGEARERGYGQVVACAPIHLEVEPR
jgi:CRISPR-associated protein Csx10